MKTPIMDQVSMEAIRYQGRSVLFHDLVSAFENLRSFPKRWDPELQAPAAFNDNDLNTVRLSDIVFKHTGMRVSFRAYDDDTSFYADPPLVDAKNPYVKLISEVTSERAARSALDRHQRVLRLSKESIASVDLKNGRVGGVFSSLFSTIYVPVYTVADENITTEELAAGLLHELGHIFSVFETIAETVAINMVVNSAVSAAQEDKDPVRTYKLISDSYSTLGMSPPPAEVTENVDPRVLTPVLLSTMFSELKKIRSVSGAHEHDARSIEAMSDQYCVRHGASIYLASLMHKLGKDLLPDYGRGDYAFYAVQALRYGLLVGLAVWSLPVGLTVTAIGTFLCYNAAEMDDAIAEPSERMATIKADLVQLLKDRKLVPEQRKQVLHDIETVDALRAQVKEHGGLIRFIYRNMVPKGRRVAAVRDFQKGIEELVGNDLFVSAARFQI